MLPPSDLHTSSPWTHGRAYVEKCTMMTPIRITLGCTRAVINRYQSLPSIVARNSSVCFLLFLSFSYFYFKFFFFFGGGGVAGVGVRD